MKVQPRKGRYFPISPARAIAATRNWLFLYWEGEKRAGSLRFANPADRATIRVPLAQLESPSSLVIFSLPERVAPRLGEVAVFRAMELSAALSADWKPVKGNVARSFVVYLEAGKELSIVEHCVHYQRRKYRGAQKFSGTFKPQVLKTEDVELQRVKLLGAV